MSEFLETAYDKFIFRVKTDCLYTREDFWAFLEGQTATVGVADFQQKAKGDVAFLETVEPGTEVRQGQAAGQIETIKATFAILSPVSGKVIEVNPQMQDSPYLINQDPYGAGWIYRIELANPQGDMAGLLKAQEYFELMKEKVAQEARNLYGQDNP
jgi:glycine cleavage system H protein